MSGKEVDELLDDDIDAPFFSVTIGNKVESSSTEEKDDGKKEGEEKKEEKKSVTKTTGKKFVTPKKKKETDDKKTETDKEDKKEQVEKKAEEDGEKESPVKRARKSSSPKKTKEKKPAKKRSRASRKDDIIEDDEDEDEDEDEDDMDVSDPEDEDVEGKGYKTVVALTSVSAESKKGIVSKIKSHGGHMTKELGLATHVVCELHQRTIKLMCAILRGLWILNTSWVTDNKSEDSLPAEEPYELKEYPGVRVSRLKHAESDFKPLFYGQSFACGHTVQKTIRTNPVRKEIEQLVAAGGGKLLKEIDKADFFISAPGRAIPAGIPDHVKVISQNEFFDAISNYVALVPKTPGEKKLVEEKESTKEDGEKSKDDEKADEKKEVKPASDDAVDDAILAEL